MAATDLSGSSYAGRRKELITVIKEIRAAGAQSDLDLPRITVIGNQSAGKSSVVESISGITVPRDAGTCTRCPMECRMACSSKSWNCKIFIRRECIPNTSTPLQEVHESRFGPVITDPKQVELTLRRAQLAALNPKLPFDTILSASEDELRRLSSEAVSNGAGFTHDVVCIDLEGPALTDLSFIDLPGLIQNAEPEVVSLVENIVISHIKGNCLILVALPMTDDIENQKALRLARQEDPAGIRTIGVLTKPDMLTSGQTKALEQWMDVIEGRRHPLAHGYYGTRQPNDAERAAAISTDSNKARAIEAQFFRETSPWCNARVKNRFGTVALIESLSKLLVKLIQDTLPTIRHTSSRLLEETERNLSQLPQPLLASDEEPATCMLRLITGFADDIRQYVRGDNGLTVFSNQSSFRPSKLIQQNRVAYGILKTDIRKTAPNFVPWHDSELKKANKTFINSLEDGEEDMLMDAIKEGDPFTLTAMRAHIANSITRELPNNVPFSAKVALIDAFQGRWNDIVAQCLETVKNVLNAVLTERIDERFGTYESLRLCIRSYMMELVAKHFLVCQQFLNDILGMELIPFTQNNHYLQTCTEKWEAKYKDSRSGAAPGTGDREAKRARTDKTTPDIQYLGSSSAPEGSKSRATSVSPSTGTSPGFATASKPTTFSAVPESSGAAAFSFGSGAKGGSAFSAFTASAATLTPAAGANPFGSSAPKPRSTTPATDEVHEALAALAKIGYAGLTADDLPKLLPPDENETEIHVMAEVRGYFQVAYKRIIDMSPSAIDYKFVKCVSEELQSFLIKKFALGTAEANEKCQTFLMEDPDLVDKRNELLAKQKRLLKVQYELATFAA
ncbi:P-loop containing nucleoside triphosphate hydrolase protein [Mycena floridula]|nr:P-loop containing nucleoside triphosphate hydrolase protein [Mycena floridula]